MYLPVGKVPAAPKTVGSGWNQSNQISQLLVVQIKGYCTRYLSNSCQGKEKWTSLLILLHPRLPFLFLSPPFFGLFFFPHCLHFLHFGMKSFVCVGRPADCLLIIHLWYVLQCKNGNSSQPLSSFLGKRDRLVG